MAVEMHLSNIFPFYEEIIQMGLTKPYRQILKGPSFLTSTPTQTL